MSVSLDGRVALITGAGSGIGRSHAVLMAERGADLIVNDLNLEGLAETAECAATSGGKVIQVVHDVSDIAGMARKTHTAEAELGKIDILVNNASAINLTGTLQTSMKRYDLMHHINTRGTFLTSKLCIPHLQKAENPHILNLSPPLNMEARWFGPHVAYTMAKFGMSMCVLGMAEEFKKDGIGVNGLWPRTAIATAAIQMIGGDEMMASAAMKARYANGDTRGWRFGEPEPPSLAWCTQCPASIVPALIRI